MLEEVAVLPPQSTANYKVRNPETGKWIDSSVFREEAIHHERYGYYCPDPWGTPAWVSYWEEQLRRCREGYTVDGWEITGDHYFYLNFTQIMVAVQVSETVAKKVLKFPDFWDGDYDYFWSLNIAKFGISLESLEKLKLRVKPHPDYLDGGYNMIVGKARRKGYSYKNGAICTNTYNHTRNSLTVIGAFEKKFLYPKGTMQMTSDQMEFLNKETGWRKSREVVNQISHRKASFKEVIDGVEIEQGYKSEVMALTFMDNDDAARGKDAIWVLLEEAGAFPNLEAAYKATRPGLEAGKYATGMIIIFGTGGDMESGTVDFARMFYNPKGYKLMPFINIWDENAENTVCGFFHPFYLNHEGYYDEQGNSDTERAIADEVKAREEIIKEASGSHILQGRVQEYPMNPSEAFLTVSFNDFPIVELRNRLNKVIREKLHIIKGQAVHLFRDETGKACIKPDLRHELEPIWDYEPKVKNLRGAVVMFEAPIEAPPFGLYKIGFDPYRQVDGTSLACITVFKGTHKQSLTRKNNIVAQYIGRPGDPDDVNRIAELLAEVYNTQVMHENEVTHVKNYFSRRNKLKLLAAQPDEVISSNVNNSKVARIYGCHMIDKLKDAGEKYIKKWLIEVIDYDEFGNGLTAIDFIDDPGFLEELILYNRKGNFDRVMAFMMVMFQVEEEDLGKEYDENEYTDRVAEMDDYLNSLYKRN